MPAKLVFYPANILKERAAEATPGMLNTRFAIEEMKTALKATKRTAIGISAPQIGVGLRIFIMDTAYLKVKCPKVFINPVVTWSSELLSDFSEGCLSFPDSVGVNIRRPTGCTIDAYGLNGEVFTVELRGMAARCALHEVDHLDGKTIIDYATPKKKKDILKKIVLDIKRGKH